MAVLEIEFWVTGVVGVPTVSRSPPSRGTTITWEDMAGGGEAGLQVCSTASWLLMAPITTVLLETSPLMLLGFASMQGAGNKLLRYHSFVCPFTLYWAVVWGPHPDSFTTTTMATQLHLQSPTLSFPQPHLPYTFKYVHLHVY